MSTYVIVKKYMRRVKRNRYKPRIYRNPSISAFSLEDEEFKKLYLLSKSGVKRLCGVLWQELEPKSGIKTAIAGEIKLLCALHYFATGFMQKQIGQEITLNLSQAAVSRSVVAVSEAISKLLLNQITFPRSHQYEDVKSAFSDLGGFPGVIGAVECHHFPINTPADIEGSTPSHAYFNPNGQHSLNVLLVCDADMKITYLNAQYPGATMDWFVWKHSNLHLIMENEFSKENCDSWLLGNNNFQPELWMLTPIKQPNSIAEKTYNLCHERTRKVIQDCVSLLKSRFGVLRSCLRHDPITAERIINSCAVLHNMCLEEEGNGEPFLLNEDEDESCVNPEKHAYIYIPIDDKTNAISLSHRKKIVQRYFS